MDNKKKPIGFVNKFGANLINSSNLYDGNPYIVDNSTGEILRESDLKKRFSYQDTQLVKPQREKPERPKPFRNDDPSTYPKNQMGKIDMWEQMLETAKNPKDKYERQEAKEVRETIRDKYKNRDLRKTLGDDELKLIGKHPTQLFPTTYAKIEPTVTASKPKVKATVTPSEPEKSLEQQIREFADKEKQKRISKLRTTHGNGGITEVYYKDFI